MSAEAGIETAVIIGFLFTLIRIAFARTTLITNENRAAQYPASEADEIQQPKTRDSYNINNLPCDTKLFKFNESIFFPNAEKIRDGIMDTIQTYSQPALHGIEDPEKERLWSDSHDRKIAELRKNAGITDLDLPRTRVVILDMGNVAFIDTTGLQALADLKAELIGWVGVDLDMRFVGMRKGVRRRFERIGWRLVDAWEQVGEDDGEGEINGDLVFENVSDAVRWVGDGRETRSASRVGSIGTMSDGSLSSGVLSRSGTVKSSRFDEKEVRVTEGSISEKMV